MTNYDKVVEEIARWFQKNTDFACNLEWKDFSDEARDNFRIQAESLLRLRLNNIPLSDLIKKYLELVGNTERINKKGG